MDKLLMIGELLANDEDLRRVAQWAGYQVIYAPDREEGLRRLRSDQPSVLMLDHRLEDCDGVDLLREARSEDPTCEAILITGDGQIDTAIDVLRAGALDYLARPVDLDQLRVALGRAQERKAQIKTVERPAILILEDHTPTRKRMVRVLEKEGYRVDSASDGEEGLKKFQETRFDLILADIRMPGKSGLSVLRETKEMDPDVEVIVITGYGDEDIVVQALRDGAINFLKKPVDIDQMLLAIEKALDHQKTRRSLAYRNRDMELMQDLVVRLTRKLELVVDAPKKLSDEVNNLLHQLVDSLPFGIAVCGADRRIIFVNSHVTEKTRQPPTRLEAGWLEAIGIELTEEKLSAAFDRTMSAKAGTVDNLVVSQWSFLIMTPFRLVRRDSVERIVAMAIRCERAPTD